MIIKKATQVGNPVIRRKAKKLSDPKSKEAQRAVKDLIDSMCHHGLVGMAAPQIGKSLRIFVSKIRMTKVRRNKKDLDRLRVYINPRIVWRSKKMSVGYEGCGSVASADLFGAVERHESIVVRALDRHGKNFKLKANGLLARVIQHELDHINGIVFTDRADKRSYMSGSEYLRKVKKERSR